MRICVLSTSRSAFSPLLYGKEAETLQRAGHDVAIVAPCRPDEEPTDPRTNYLGIRVIPLTRMGTGTRWQKLQTLPRLLIQAVQQPSDVYQAMEPPSLLIGALVKLIRRRPLIYDSREYYPLAYAVNTGLGPRATRMLTRFFSVFESLLVVLFADHVFAVDQGCLERFQRLGRPASLLTNYPRRNFASTQQHQPPPSHDSTSFEILYTGFTYRRNAVLETIRAVAILRESGQFVHATFLGLIDDQAFLAECEALCRQLDVEDSVTLMGRVSHDEIAQYLESADCGSLLYHYTLYTEYATHPVKLFEYMAFGLPVICSNLPNMARMVRDVNCGIVTDADDPQTIADALATLIRSPELAAQLGSHGREAFIKRYNWDAMEPSFLAVYEQLTTSRSRLGDLLARFYRIEHGSAN